MKSNLLRLVLPLAVLGFVAAGTAAAQTAIPGGTHSTTFVINKPGSYYLAGNRTMSDPGKHVIEITARDVTLDLRGFSLSHSGKGYGMGIRVETVENVEIRNGSIVAAALHGISTGSGAGLRLIDLRVIAPAHTGLFVHANETMIERCYVTDAGDNGIRLNGVGSSVKDCFVGNSGSIGLNVGSWSRVVRVNVRGGSVGVSLGQGSTLEESSVTNSSGTGVSAQALSTIRGCQITSHLVRGVSSIGGSVALYENRFATNALNIYGGYLNGGGNLFQ